MQQGHTLARRVVTTLLFALLLGARAVSAGSISIQWDANTEHDVVGYRVFIGTQPGTYSQSVDVGNTTTYVFNSALDGQRYCFAVAAYSAGPLLGDKSIEVCSDASGNQPPTLKNPGALTSPVGVALTLQLEGNDPESSPVTYAAVGLPAGLTLNKNTGFISGTPTVATTYNVKATVSDGDSTMTQAFTWKIAAGLPVAATLLRPSGSIASNTPTFEWESVATATSYRLWVDDSSTTDPKVQIDLTPAQAGCSTTGAVCQAKPGIVLAGGRASWSVRASNASGPGPWSGAMDFTVPDGKVPTVAIASPTSNATFSTGNATIALGGTATDDLAVTQVTWANSRGGSGTAAGTTAWAVASIPLQSGSNTLTITARDAAGNVATDVLTVTRTDGTAPVVTIATPTGNGNYTTAKTALMLAGTASDDAGVTKVTWANTLGGSGTAAGTTNWTVGEVPLRAGANVITVTAFDAAGNKSTDVLTVTLTDDVAPGVTILGPTVEPTLSVTMSEIGLRGSASDAFGVTQVTWANNRGGSGVAVGTTAWSVNAVPLKGGINVITVTARDASGATGTDTLTVTVADTSAPTISIAAPTSAPQYQTGSAEIAIGGIANDDVGVTEVTWKTDKGASGVAVGTSGWGVAKVPVGAGVTIIRVTATDAAGNSTSDFLAVTRVDSSAPTVDITTPTAQPTFSTASMTVAVGGTAADNSGVAQVAWSNNQGGSGVATGTTAWSASVPLKAGANVITITAKDTLGNVGTDTLTITVTDGVAPTVAIATPTAAATHSTTATSVALGGSAADSVGVTEVRWANSRGGAGVATGTTAWTVAAIALQSGANVITVTARDAAGNTATDAITITLDSDTKAPTLAIVTPTAAGSLSTTDIGIALAGTASDASGIADVSWVNSLGGSGAASGTTAWSTTRIALKSGLNTITITARDKAGNSATATLAVRATDVQAPVIRVTSPTGEAAMAAAVNTVTLEGTTTDDFGPVRVTWTSDRGGSGVANGDARWTASGVALQPGVNVITFTARDAAGNASSAVIRVTHDRGAPTISLTSPTTGAAYASAAPTVALTGVASDETAVSRVTWTTDKGQAGVATGTTSWSIPSVALTLGATTVVTVTAHDNSGNATSVSLPVSYADASVPVVKVYMPTTATSFTTSAASITIGGTATDNVGVTHVSWSNNQGGSGEMFGTASWTALGIPLTRGLNVITVTARDAAGNTGVTVLSVNAVTSSSQSAAR